MICKELQCVITKKILHFHTIYLKDRKSDYLARAFDTHAVSRLEFLTWRIYRKILTVRHQLARTNLKRYQKIVFIFTTLISSLLIKLHHELSLYGENCSQCLWGRSCRGWGICHLLLCPTLCLAYQGWQLH